MKSERKIEKAKHHNKLKEKKTMFLPGVRCSLSCLFIVSVINFKTWAYHSN